jgi:four helix bundle protein
VAKRVEDLIIWQLADQLSTQVYALSERQCVRQNFRFFNQFTDAASSATRNVSEGFGRYRHREFAQMVSTSRASVLEIHDLLRDGVKRRFWTKTEVAEAVHLTYRAAKAMARFIEYLRSTSDPPGSF